MRVRRIFAAPHLYPSDSARHYPRRVGMLGLRHKSRHKKTAGRKLLSGPFAGTQSMFAEVGSANRTTGGFAFASLHKISGLALSKPLVLPPGFLNN
jgi:hypothetical protein